MKPLLKIGPFELYKKRPNTISKGFLYTAELEFDVPNVDRKRLVRVYLPTPINMTLPLS